MSDIPETLKTVALNFKDVTKLQLELDILS